MDLYSELVGLVEAFEDARIDYALCGGLAVAFHGYARFTKDIDMLVPRNQLERAREAAEALGFLAQAIPMRFQAGLEAECEVHRITKVEGDEFLSLDLIVPGEGLEKVWEGSLIFPWRDRSIRVVSREGLLRMKRLAGRDQDVLDIKKLTHGND